MLVMWQLVTTREDRHADGWWQGIPYSKKGFTDAKNASKETGTKMSFAPKKKKKKSAMNGGYSRE